jgi:small-conductance mechanosensitive channel
VLSKEAEIEQVDIATLAEARGLLIVDAIIEYRDSRSEEALSHSWVVAAGWTGVFLAYCTILIIIFRFALHHTYTHVDKWVAMVEDKTGKMAETDVLVTVIRLTLWMIAFALFFLALYYYLSQVLFSFPTTRSFAAILLNNFSEPVLALGIAFVETIPDFVALGVIFFLTRYFLKIVRLVFVNIELGVIESKGFEQDWTWPTFRIVRGVLVAFLIVIAYPYVPGSGTEAFQGMTIFLGVILTLGSSSIISNLLARLFVIYRRGVNKGDLIEIDDHMGKVESVLVLETMLRTPRNELISIPNSKLLGASLTNYSRGGPTAGLMISTKVGIGYEEPQTKIEAMLLEAAARTKGFKNTPAPFVLRSGLADFAVVYEVFAIPNSIDGLPRLRSDLHANILDVFNERRVQIMTPAYDRDPPDPKIAPVETAPA